MLLHQAPNVDLVCLFSPEHGIAGQLDQSKIEDTTDPETGLPVYSLYGESRRPSAKHLAQIDTLVFDIQDIGTRFYTYISTMGDALRAAAENDVQFWVLDRPNPLGGLSVRGPVLDPGRESFVGFHTLPVVHGMTVGELAKMFNDELAGELGGELAGELAGENSHNADLQVVPVEGWERSMRWDQTGLLWINPSPNMRTPQQSLLYSGVGLLETTNLSVGRGTDTPFEIVGAPWIDNPDAVANQWELASRLNSRGLRGLRFVPVRFTPSASKFSDQRCGGVRIQITNRDLVQPLRLGIELACALRDLFPEQWELQRIDRLLCDQRVLERLHSGATPRQIESAYQAELADFLQRRQRYLIYE
jgi:uncharacterized protein YbbC (DUF1343 family)